MYDVAIIGGGVCGCLLAYQLSRYNLRVALLEKDNDVGVGTTKANSAIAHAGYDPEPGTLMAKYNLAGSRMMPGLCQRLDVPYKNIGSLVVGFSEEERAAVEELYSRGLENGVTGLEIWEREELHQREPALASEALFALYAPTAGIVSPWELALAQAEVAAKNGVEFYLEREVTDISPQAAGGFAVETKFAGHPDSAALSAAAEQQTLNPGLFKNNSELNQGKFIQNGAVEETSQSNSAGLGGHMPTQKPCSTPAELTLKARFVVNAAGVAAADINAMAGGEAFAIHPSRGEYFLLDTTQGSLAKHVIFQCPNKDGKGVLVSPTVHGNLIVGPNAEPAKADDFATTAEGLAFVRKMAVKSVPGIGFSDSIRNFAGLRAVADTGDFIVGPSKAVPGFFNIAGIKSPGLTAAPAIGADMVNMLAAAGLPLEEKQNFEDGRQVLRFDHLTHEQRAVATRQNPLYGHVVCRCRTVTEGEIQDALHRPIPPRSLDGVKRRCSPGMGRCQGGFCGPKVQAMMAQHYGVAQSQIPQSHPGTTIIFGETKDSEEVAAHDADINH